MKTIQKVALASLVAGTATAAGDANAAYDAFIKIDGIVGSSTFKGEEGAIELSSVEFSASSSVTVSATGKGVASGKRTFSPIVIQKVFDSSSVNLFKAFTEGELRNAEIDFIKTAANTESAPYLKIELSEAVISSYSFSSAGGAEAPTESLSLTFTKIEESFTGTAGGKVDTTTTASWDIATNKVD